MKAKCPICKKKVVWKDNPSRPFCSDRCRITDLGKWASDAYRIETQEKESETREIIGSNGRK